MDASDRSLSTVVARAREYKRVLRRVKADLGDPGFAWYKYDSLSSIEFLEKVLAGAPCNPFELAAGKPVLDIGAADGDIAFFLEHLGHPVHAVDFSPTNANRMAGIRTLKQALGSSVEVLDMDLDRLADLPVARFSLALCLGILYHLKNPFYLLETLARHADYCLLSTRITQLDGTRSVDLSAIPVAYLVDADELNADATNYWIFTETGLHRILKRAGWEVLTCVTSGCRRGADPVRDDADQRAFCFLRSRLASPGWRAIPLHGWHAVEGGFRWTEQRFSLRVVHDAPATIETLGLRFYLPEHVLAQLGPLTVTARVNGLDLPPQRITNPGDNTYQQPLPPAAPAAGHDIEFALSRALAPTAADHRQLGIVVPLDPDGRLPLLLT